MAVTSHGPSSLTSTTSGGGTPLEGATVLIVDDHRLFADAIRSVLERSGARQVDVAGSIDEAMDLATRHRPTLALVSLTLSEAEQGDGIQVGERILAEVPSTRVLGMAGSDESAKIARALASGFQGIAIKDHSLKGFLTAVETTLRSRAGTPTPLRFANNGRSSRPMTSETLLVGQLTSREFHVLQLLVEGLASGRIADQLGISSNTVRSHIQSVLHKLHVHSRLEAAAFAVRHELFRQPRPRSAQRSA
jgi:two-component system nitrate/nitrite response regulator NarL